MDWNLAGEVSFTSYPTPDTGPAYAARSFIQDGGPISFSGVVHRGGYNSARRVLEFLFLLEDVGRWNVTEFCHILRILSDALIDLDSGGSN